MTTTIELIKSLRDMGMTQTAISQKSGVSQPKISRWESGGIPSSADDALRLRSLHESETVARGPCEKVVRKVRKKAVRKTRSKAAA